MLVSFLVLFKTFAYPEYSMLEKILLRFLSGTYTAFFFMFKCMTNLANNYLERGNS